VDTVKRDIFLPVLREERAVAKAGSGRMPEAGQEIISVPASAERRGSP